MNRQRALELLTGIKPGLRPYIEQERVNV